MNLNALKAFVLTTELGSISCAAKAMSKGRVQVSQWIANLELDWNVELFDRNGHKPKLTEQGTLLLQKTKSMLDVTRQLESQVASINTSGLNRLSIGVSCYLDSSCTSKAIKQIKQRHPGILIDVHIAPCDDLIASDDYDFLLCHYPHSTTQSWQFQHVKNRQFITVCAPSHPLAQLEEVASDHLNLHLALAYTQQQADSYWSYQHFDAMWVNDIQVAKNLCIEGLGWMSIDQANVSQELARKQLVIINHKDAVQQAKFGIGHKNNPLLQDVKAALYQALTS